MSACFFQNDNINTLDTDSEFRLVIMAGVAQIEEFKERNDGLNNQRKDCESQRAAIRQEQQRNQGRERNVEENRQTLKRELRFADGINSALVATILKQVVVKLKIHVSFPFPGFCIKSTAATTAKITGVKVKVGETTYESGNVTLTPDSGDVTIIVTGENLDKLNGQVHKLYCIPGLYSGLDTADWTYDSESKTVTKVYTAVAFSGWTTSHQICYTNAYNNENADTTVWENTGIYITYQSSTTSVAITWGAMSFVYSDEQVSGADKGWSCETGANAVTVQNNGSNTLNVGIAYKAETGYSEITGSFGDTAEATLSSTQSKTFALTLSGKPGKAIAAGTKIGQLTLTITQQTGGQ